MTQGNKNKIVKVVQEEGAKAVLGVVIEMIGTAMIYQSLRKKPEADIKGTNEWK